MLKPGLYQLIILGFVLILGMLLGGVLLSGQAVAQEPAGDISAQAVVGTAFTYQGRLMRGSTPVAGTCSLTFRLYGSGSGSDQVGPDVTKASVQVSDGYLAESLDFGNVFTGEERWLEITINSCSDGSGSGTLSPRVALNPTPYALSLRPGATITGSTTVLTAYNTSSSGGPALYGEATDFGAENYGVMGRTVSVQGAGIYGEAYSIVGGKGVYGKSFVGTGVYGETSHPNGYGVYSQGRAHIEGALSWKPITSYVSVSAAAFRPYQDDYDYRNSGLALTNVDGSSQNYRAPVQLPHEATVTGLAFYWQDNYAGGDARCILARNELNGVGNVLFNITSSGSAGAGSTVGTCTNYCEVDNSQYAYFLEWYLPYSTTTGYGVVISYTVEQPY